MTGKSPRSTESDNVDMLLQTLKQLQRDAETGTFDNERVQRVTEALLEHYQQSTDAARFEEPLEGPRMLAQFSALNASVTLATLNCLDLEETLFDVIPARVSVGPGKAKNIVETNRAFYVWLKREHALEPVDDIINLLNDDAIRELEEDAVMQRQMDSDATLGASPLYDDPFGSYREKAPSPLTPEQQRASQKKRKKNRKSSRKARKKNR